MATLFVWLIIIVLALACVAVGIVVAGFIIARTYKPNPNDSSVGSSLLQALYALIFGVLGGLALFGLLYWLFGAALWAL